MTHTSAYPRLLLVDNGSLRPQAVLALRELAEDLSERINRTVIPASLAHVDRIDPSELGGEPARTLEQVVEERLQVGDRNFLLLPLFFGESGALTRALPRQLENLMRRHAAFHWALAEPLGPLRDEDTAMAELLQELARLSAVQAGLQQPRICLVDHGSPSKAVTAVRHRLATQLSKGLQQPVDEAAMERRAGVEYDFNGLLLAEWLEHQAEEGAPEILLLLQFLLPGRHAGSGGDIEAIIARVMEQHPGLCIATSPLVSEHPQLVDILLQRLRDAEARFKLAHSV